MVHVKLGLFPQNSFSGDDWRFWGFGFIWSSNISSNGSVSWQHVLAVTSVFPHWLASYMKTSIQYIWQCVSSLNLAGLIFSFSLSLSYSLIPLICAFLLSFFFFSSPFPGVPLSGPRTQHFPTECGAEGWAIVSCYRETRRGGGGRRQAWLPGCQLGVYVSVRKSRGDRSDDDRGTVYLLEWL